MLLHAAVCLKSMLSIGWVDLGGLYPSEVEWYTIIVQTCGFCDGT